MPAGAEVRSPARVLGAGFFAGLCAGAAAGVIDGLWSWGPVEQFLPSVWGKLRLLWFLAASHAVAGALAGAALTGLVLYFSRATRLGDLWRHALAAHRRTREADPRGALAGLSLAIAAVPVVSAALGLAYVLAYRGLAERRHLGLMIAVAMAVAIVAAAAALLASFALARPIEAGLRRLATRPVLARALSEPAAPAVAAALLAGGALAAAAALAHETLSLLDLRPYVVLLLGAVLFLPCLRIGRELAARAARLAPGVRVLAIAGALVAPFVLLLWTGSPDSIRKAATSYTGLSDPLIRFYQTLGDLDRDGYSRWLGGGDCNDWDPDINPGAPEIPDDGIDNNCVGGDATSHRSVEEVAFAAVPPSVPAEANVVLVTIDTIRSDHVSAYGYRRPTTPALDALAAEGALFENSWAHASSTRYSMPAILTGRHPLQVDYDTSVQGWPGLSEKNTTIAEILAARGFATGAILNHWYFDPQRRMNQGFDHYDNENRRLHKGVPGQGPAETQGSSSREQTDKAIAWVRGVADERFFLWVHYYDPHYRYERRPGVPDWGDRDIDLYDGEIRYTDNHIGRLFDGLRRLGVYDRTIVVVAGDHGESFGENGIILHGYHLYAPQTRVPLIIRVPGLDPQRVTMPVGHVDILPTLANLVGSQPTREMRGRSLVDVLSGAADPDADRWVFQQLSYEGPTEMRGAANKQCHVIYNVSPHRSWELYRLDIDPLGTRDVIDDPGPCRDARAVLEVWYNHSEIPDGAAEALLAERPEVARPIDVRLHRAAVLRGVELPEAPVARGDSFDVTYTFEVTGRLRGNWRVFAHFEAGGGGRFLGDHEPTRPPSWWRPGQHIRYTRTVTVPPNARPGVYTLWTGLFEGNQRRRADSSLVEVRDDRAAAGTMTVK